MPAREELTQLTRQRKEHASGEDRENPIDGAFHANAGQVIRRHHGCGRSGFAWDSLAALAFR
jgi:hypothetical protein